MKLPDAYTLKRHLVTNTAHIIFVLLCGALMLAVGLSGYYSKEGDLYHANQQAATEFVRTMENDWPNNRANVFFALGNMRSAYINTGENATDKFAKLDRLQDWFLRSQTAGEEILFLSEVRAHGRVVASQPMLCNTEFIFAMVLIVEIAAILAYIVFMKWLQGTDPRLRPFSA